MPVCAAAPTVVGLPAMDASTCFASRVLNRLRNPAQLLTMNRSFGGLSMAACGVGATMNRSFGGLSMAACGVGATVGHCARGV